MIADLQVKIGCLGFNSAAQEIVDAQGHGLPVSIGRRRSNERSIRANGRASAPQASDAA